MQTLWQDVRYAVRGLRNAPGLAVTVVLTLALGLGAVTAMLAIVDCVLVRPVALSHADRLVSFSHIANGKADQQMLYSDLEPLRTGVGGFAAVAASSTQLIPMTTSDGSRVGLATRVSADFFAVGGVAARMGRVLGAADAHAPVTVVTDAFWQDTLHGNPHVLGSTIRLKDRLFTVVGVMPPGFSMPGVMKGPIVYVPLVLDAKGADQDGVDRTGFLARVKPGVSMASATAEARAVYARGHGAPGESRGELVLRPDQQFVTEDEQPALLALLGACALLLLIACANSANLQIARGIRRTGEMGVRAALGASRGRLARQIATESVTISLLGAALGLSLAYTALHAIRAAYGLRFTRFDELTVNPSVFLACALLAITAGVLASLAPSWRAARDAGSFHGSLATRATRRSRLSGSLVALEIALTCVLLITAGLFIRSYRALAQAPFGFDARHVTAINLLPNNAEPNGAALKQTYDRLLGRLAAIPGVEAAATETSLPYSRFMIDWTSHFRFAGQPERDGNLIHLSLISAGFERTLAMPVRQGRGILPSDVLGARPVCLVSEGFARRFLHGQQVLNRTVVFTSKDPEAEKDSLFKTARTIVGVLPDEVRDRSPAIVLIPYAQVPADSDAARFLFGMAPQFAVRSSLPQAALERQLRTALKDAAPEMAEMQISPLEANIVKTFENQQLALRIASGFGLLALALAAVGIYGVLAFSVAERTREIGIRMALGSTRGGAMRFVLRQAATMVAFGLAAGLLCAWPAGHAVRAFLFGVTPLDPVTVGAAVVALLLVGASAAVIPAWRAAQVDPTEALRRE